MNYITVKEAASRWNLSERRIQMLCKEGRILGSKKQSGIWIIPSSASKPFDKLQISPLKVVSLFSGCGGMDLGFEGGFSVHKSSFNPRINEDWNVKTLHNNRVYLPPTRFETIFANDIRPDAQTAWTTYFSKFGRKESVYCLDSIVDLVRLEKNNNVDIFPKEASVVTGGFPCQDFSIAGKRLGFNSEKSHIGDTLHKEAPSIENRGKLYMWMREVIELVEPNLFVAENVKGLANLGDVKQIIEADFSSVSKDGYLVIPARILLAANYGVPQSRERVIFIGLKRASLRPDILEKLSKEHIPVELDPYPAITHSSDNIPGLAPFVTVREVFEGLDEPHLSQDIDQQNFSRAKYYGKHVQGQTEVNLDGIGPTIRAEHHGNIEFRRLNLKNGGKYEEEFRKGLKQRRLTIRECARLQTFPDDYKFIQKARAGYKNVTTSDAYKLIGNALPPLLGYHIAKRIESLWELYFTS